MIRAVLSQASRIAPMALLAAGVLVAAPALAETAKKGPSVTAGDQVAAAAAGKAATGTTGALGVALSTAADGAPVRVLFNR